MTNIIAYGETIGGNQNVQSLAESEQHFPGDCSTLSASAHIFTEHLAIFASVESADVVGSVSEPSAVADGLSLDTRLSIIKLPGLLRLTARYRRRF